MITLHVILLLVYKFIVQCTVYMVAISFFHGEILIIDGQVIRVGRCLVLKSLKGKIAFACVMFEKPNIHGLVRCF